MRVATIRRDGGTRAVRVQGDEAVLLPFRDVRELLATGPGWRDAASAPGEHVPLDEHDLAPVVPQPDKIVCVGLNYRMHADEGGLEVPDHPTLFAKYAGSLIGARDDIRLPRSSTQVDWEAEVCAVIGQPIRRGDEEAAANAIAGYTVANDVSMRDWQMRTSQWLQGKTFEASTPVGPHLVTLDELDDPNDLELTCDVDGERVQTVRTSEILVSPAQVVAYLSQIITLVPGDLILTGTGAGVGLAMTPPRFLGPDSVVTTTLQGVGQLSNRCVPEDV